MQQKSQTTRRSADVDRRRGRSEERRRSILEAAYRAIRRVGSELSMEEIAEEARISRPILYRHFGDRRGMAEAIAKDAVSRAIGAQAGTLDKGVVPNWVAASDLQTTLKEILCRTLDFVESQPELYRFILKERAFRDIHPEGDSTSGPLGILVVPLRAALTREGFDATSAEFRATAMAGMLTATISWNLESRRYDRAALQTRLIELCMQLGRSEAT